MSKQKIILVTGSSGLIGSEACEYFSEQGYTVHGVDNNMRAFFFGKQGDTRWNQKRMETEMRGFVHHELDIRDREGILELFKPCGPPPLFIRQRSRPTTVRRQSPLKTLIPTPAEP